jgi:DNA-binding SARP family transcriptional activator
VEFRILGPFEARDGDRVLRIREGKQRALLALLLVNANRTLAIERIVDELWGERAPESASKMVQVYVSRLRKLLPDGILLTRPPGYALELEPEQLDVRRFERLLAEGRAALADGGAERAAARLAEALALWRGPALAEFASEPFAKPEGARLEDLRLAALEERIEADLACGRQADLAAELESLVARHPLREGLRRRQMLALYRSGRQAEALAAYLEARRVLAEELGLEPSRPCASSSAESSSRIRGSSSQAASPSLRLPHQRRTRKRATRAAATLRSRTRSPERVRSTSCSFPVTSPM